MPLMPELPGSLPRADTLERAAASRASAPDPAWIAAIANSLFRGAPGEPPRAGGEPALGACLRPSSLLSRQMPGAAGSVHRRFRRILRPAPPAYRDLARARLQSRSMAMSRLNKTGTPAPAETVLALWRAGQPEPCGRRRRFLRAALPISDRRRANRFLSEADLAALPGTLGGVMSIIPPLNGSTPYGGPSAGLPSAPAAAPRPSPSASAPASACLCVRAAELCGLARWRVVRAAIGRAKAVMRSDNRSRSKPAAPGLGAAPTLARVIISSMKA